MAEQHLVPQLVNANLDVIEAEVLSKLPTDLYELSKGASDAIGETAVVLTDGVKPDGPQVEAVWRAFVNKVLIEYARQKASAEVVKIKSDILRTLTTMLLDPATQSLKVLTDTITDDGKQLEEVWTGFLLEGTNLKTILDNTLRPALSLLSFMTPELITVVIGLAESQLRVALEKGRA